MVLDSETNIVYLSGLLEDQYPIFFDTLTNALRKRRTKYNTLLTTKDVWVRDFMPIQLNEDQFLQFKFDTDYLKPKKYRHLVSDPMELNFEMGIHAQYSDIRIDGGNIIKGKRWVIMTDKIFSENSERTKTSLVGDIEHLLKSRLIVIPRPPFDFTGHADGVVRYYDDRTVLVNQYRSDDSLYFQRLLLRSLKEAGLDVIPIPYNVYRNRTDSDATGVYINFLEVEGALFIPSFGLPSDFEALNLFRDLYPSTTVIPIHATEIAKEGGILNCISWSVKVP
jgi:agmatine deiminase